MRRSQAMNFTRFDATNVTNLTICSGGFSSNHFIQLISAIKFGSLSSIGVDGPNTLALVNAVFGSPSRNYSPLLTQKIQPFRQSIPQIYRR